MADHHKLLGRWVAGREPAGRRYTRDEARKHIEKMFEAAVLEILKPVALVNLRVVAIRGEGGLPPALAIICDSVGQIDLEWIEISNVLANTMFEHVAPVGWQAAAYSALVETLIAVLPIFSYNDLFEEVSAYYWDGADDDESARETLIAYHGAEAEDLDTMVLPSTMNARRPAWMDAKKAYPLKHLPDVLQKRIRRLRDAHRAIKALGAEGNAWHFDSTEIDLHLPGYFEDCSHLPPMTLVPFQHFENELDDVCRHGMETGFLDIAGLCPLPDVGAVDDWFASLRLGVEFLLAAQDLIYSDPSKP